MKHDQQHRHLNDALELAGLLRPTWPDLTAAIVATGAATCLESDTGLREKLKKVEADTGEAREKLATLVKTRDEARDAFASSDETSTTSPEFIAAKEAVAAVGAQEDHLDELQKAHVGILEMLAGKASKDDQRSHDAPPGPATPWATADLLRDEAVRASLQEMASSTMRVGRVVLGQVVERDAFAADVTGTANMRRGAFAGVVPQLRRQLRVLDLIPVGTMDENTLPYTQESGSFATAAETPEGDLKPEAAVTYTDKTATAATIAHWTVIRKQALADVAAMQSIIDGRLRYGVELRLQDQVLAGDGAGENIRGILQTTGIGNVAFDAGELEADQILEGVTIVFLSNGEANGIVMHPTDWKKVLKAKAAGDGHYYSGGPFSITPQVMWGVPLIPSASIPQGRALVGDFNLGAQVFIREGVNVLVSDSDSDNFRRNKVTLLGEMRAALAVWQPAVFAAVELAA